VVLVALFLRVYALGSQSFWIDEINVTSFVRSGHLFSDLRDRGGPFEPPLHYLAVFAALRLPFGFETAARIPSAFFGTLEVLALILLTREVTNRRLTAIVAGALLAVAPFVVRYSQENRYYVMFSALSLLSWWLLARAFRVRGRGPWVAYGAMAAAMQLTHPFAPLVLIIQALVVAFFAWRARKAKAAGPILRGYGISIVVGIVLILPWYIYGASDWIDGIANGKSYGFNPEGRYSVPIDTALFTRFGEWLLGNSTRPTVLVITLLVLVFAAPLLARKRDRRVALFALGYTVGFVLVLVPLARAIGTYFAYRRIESLVPPMLLLVAIALVALVERLVQLHVDRRVAYAIGGVATAAIVALSLAATISYYGTEKSNYRAVARAVHDAPADRTVVVGPSAFPPLIRAYLHWKGVDRDVIFILAKQPPPPIPLTAGGITWLTGASPNQPDMTTLPLNNLDQMQVIAGDSSGPLVIVPWFVSMSNPQTTNDFNRQATVVAGLPHLLPPPK
jgi:4-amino-4-deoxy-L-arabinose transferase-like glycosyltransferase